MSTQYQHVKGRSRPFSHGIVMMRVFFLLFTILVISMSAFAQLARLPRGHSILVDGRISPGEWTDALTIELGRGAELLAKQHDNYVLLAVILPKESSGFVDLFISPDSSTVFDLHASAKLGERATSTADKWPDWTWWNNRDWIANVSRVESFDEKKFLPESVREFQIKRTRFSGNEWRVRLVLSIDHGQSYTELQLPEAMPGKGSEQWLTLRL